jgi:DNA-binding NtrC family response regulator
MTETELAQKLGISRKALWQKRQKHNIPREKSRRT